MNFAKNILSSKFIKNIFIVASGTAAAQAVAMLLSPIITRVYGPDAFGIMGTFNAFINIIIPVAALTYPIAIVLPKKHSEAKAIMRLSIVLGLILSVFSFILLLLLHQNIVELFKLHEISKFLFLIPLVIILSSFNQSMEQWLIRTKQFTVTARATLYQSLIVNFSKVGIGFYYPFAQVLVFLTAITNGIRGSLLYLFSKKPREFNDDVDEKIEIITVAKKHKDFPLYRAPQDLLDSFQQSFPIVLLTIFFGTAATGFYTLGRTVLRLPSSLVGKAVGDVFYPRIAEAANKNEDMATLVKKGTLLLALVGIIPYGMVLFFGPQLFGFVFGAEWVKAGEYARWISLWSYFALINRPSVRTLPVLNAQKLHLIFTSINTVLKLTLLVLSYYLFKSDTIAIALFCLSGVLSNIVLIYITIKLCKKRMM